MKSSYVAAFILALAVTGWILSGQVDFLSFQGNQTAATAAENGAKTAVKAIEKAAPSAATVRVRHFTARPHGRELTVRGRTEAQRIVDVMAETKGRVETVLVERGQRVKKDDVLVRLAVEDRDAKLAEAKAMVKQRQIEFDAAAALHKKGFTPNTKLAAAAAQLDSAKAYVQRVQVDLAHTTIRAPFDGVIERRPAEVGAYLKDGHVVARLVDEDPFLVVGQVSEREVGKLAIGGLGRAKLVTGQEVEGVVSFIAKTADPATRTFRVELEVANKDLSIRDGITAEILFKTPLVEAHFLSPAFLTLDTAGAIGLKSVDADGVVHFHKVEILSDTPDGVWLGGLPNELTVITVGQEFVRDGDTVIPLQDSEAGS